MGNRFRERDFSQDHIATMRQDQNIHLTLLILNLNPGLLLTFVRPRASVQMEGVLFLFLKINLFFNELIN